MKVKDLIKKLQGMPPDAVVINPYWSDEHSPIEEIWLVPPEECYQSELGISQAGVVRIR